MGKIEKTEVKAIHSGELTARIKKKDSKSFGKKIILKGREINNDR